MYATVLQNAQHLVLTHLIHLITYIKMGNF